ncbi:MAG: hypothetical protein DRP27_06690 [Thermotogae bacterium]|nr:MAG: hypothetical protein DRP27_06690 [Thermotogota bacterium]
MSTRRRTRNPEDTNAALSDAQRYLRYRLRSKKELEEYLRKRGYIHVAVKEVVEKLEASGIIDDERFAYVYALDNMRLKFKGPRIIRSELRRLGVSEEIVNAALTKVVEEVDFEELVARYARKLEKLDERTLRKYLSSRGFEWVHIKKIEEVLYAGGE